MPTTVRLPRSTPEAQGIPSAAVLELVAQLEQEVESLHSLMIVRHGHVIAEGWWAPYTAERRHMLFSLSKSFTATAIGAAIAEGLLSLDDPVLSFFPEDAPAEANANLAAMQVRHLLGMSAGHADDTTPALHGAEDGNWVRAFLACPVTYPPGTHFLYNTGATYMLSAIMQKLSGVTLLEYLRPRLLTPLGIEGATWETCPRGINTGGYGLSTTTEAIVNFGQLFLQEGFWQGAQLVPREWVRTATQAHIANGDDPNSDWAQGYGYQFWRCRHNAYRGDGAFGQYCVVMPEQGMVIAITAGLEEMQVVLNLIWAQLLPACGPTPLPADPAAHTALTRKLASLNLPLPVGLTTPEAAIARGRRVYQCEPNELQISTFSLEAHAAGCSLLIHDAEGEHTIAVGSGVWQPGVFTFMARGAAMSIAAAGAWPDTTTYVAEIYYVETPFRVTLTCRVTDDRLLLDVGVNVSFGPTSFPQIVGMAEQS
jgi:CubicO group peptidase (beta-lactamase class C family)